MLFRSVRLVTSLVRTGWRAPSCAPSFAPPPRAPMCSPLTPVHLRRDRSAQKDATKNVKLTASYVPLRAALQHRWTSMTRRQTKELNPAVPFSVLGACLSSPDPLPRAIGSSDVCRNLAPFLQPSGSTKPPTAAPSRTTRRRRRSSRRSRTSLSLMRTSTSKSSPASPRTSSSACRPRPPLTSPGVAYRRVSPPPLPPLPAALPY